MIFLEALQFQAMVSQLRTFYMDIAHTHTCPARNSNNIFEGYAMFDCHANFYINWESFAQMDQQKTC